MGLWDWLVGGKDPAADWVADPSVESVLDLGRPSLCGISLGDSVSQVERLGPPDNRNASKLESYVFRDRGLMIEADEGIVVSFTVFFDEDKSTEGCSPFSGITMRGDRQITLSHDTSEREWSELFGEAYWRDVDDGEILLFLELGQVEWQAEFTTDGDLSVLTIVTPPTLSKPDQREAYGVDKVWPPQ